MKMFQIILIVLPILFCGCEDNPEPKPMDSRFVPTNIPKTNFWHIRDTKTGAEFLCRNEWIIEIKPDTSVEK